MMALSAGARKRKEKKATKWRPLSGRQPCSLFKADCSAVEETTCKRGGQWKEKKSLDYDSHEPSFGPIGRLHDDEDSGERVLSTGCKIPVLF